MQLDVFEESIAEVLGRRRRTMAKLLQYVRRGSGMDSVWQGRSLTSRWREAIDNPDARCVSHCASTGSVAGG